MAVKYDKVLGRLRENDLGSGFSGDLVDSNLNVIATVSNGLITAVNYSLDAVLLQGGDSVLLQSGGTNTVLLQ